MKTKAFWKAVAVLGAVGLGGCEAGQTGPVSVTDDAVTITIAPFDVAPGQEVQNCHYFKLPSDADIDVNHVTMDFSLGTHHAHIYYGAEAHPDGIEECFTAVDFEKWHLLAATQREKLEWQLPPGQALRLKAHQQLLVQVHYTNAQLLVTEANRAHGTMVLDRVEPTKVTGHLGTVFGQQRTIHVAPHSTYSITGLCQLPRAADLAAFAGHYHFRGQDFIGYKTDTTGVRQDEFYRSDNFAEPKFTIYDASNPMHFAQNERIMWHCDYDNQTDLDIPFGPHEVNQEHCNMFVFYYPAAGEQEFTPCVSWGRCPVQCAAGQTCSTAGTCVAQ